MVLSAGGAVFGQCSSTETRRKGMCSQFGSIVFRINIGVNTINHNVKFAIHIYPVPPPPQDTINNDKFFFKRFIIFLIQEMWIVYHYYRLIAKKTSR